MLFFTFYSCRLFASLNDFFYFLEVLLNKKTYTRITINFNENT